MSREDFVPLGLDELISELRKFMEEESIKSYEGPDFRTELNHAYHVFLLRSAIMLLEDDE